MMKTVNKYNIFIPHIGCPEIRIRKGFAVEFEFDPVKSKANEAKHGIDFLEAQES